MSGEKERLLNAINGNDVDRVPVICPGGMMNMVTKEAMDIAKEYLPMAHTDAKMMAKLASSIYENKIFENAGVPFCMTVEAEMYGAPIDMGSDIFEPHVKGYLIKSVEDYKSLKKANIETGRAKVVSDAIKLIKDKNPNIPLIGNVTGPISVASSLMEPVMFYKELRRKNKLAHEYLEMISSDIAEFALMQAKVGADIITIAEPSGTGEILGPKLFEEFCVTYINKITDKLMAEGIKTIVHICGQMKAVYEKLDMINADVLSFDSIVPIKVVKKVVSNKRIMGNISTLTLENGDPSQIKKMAHQCIKSGTDILSPACGLGMRTSIKNIKAILEGVMEMEY